MASTQNSTVDFPVSKNRQIILSFPALSRLLPQTSLVRNVAFTSQKQLSEIVMKQPTLLYFHFKNSSNDQDKLSRSTSRENTDSRFAVNSRHL